MAHGASERKEAVPLNYALLNCVIYTINLCLVKLLSHSLSSSQATAAPFTNLFPVENNLDDSQIINTEEV